MQLYVGLNGRQEGPFSLLQVHDLLEAGDIDGSTLGWMTGEAAWKPLREIPAVLGLIQSLEKEKLDASLAKTARPTVPPPPSVPTNRLPTHTFSRFGARMIDIMLLQMIVSSFWSLPAAPESLPEPQDYATTWAYLQEVFRSFQDPENPELLQYSWNLHLFQMACVFLWHLVEPFWLALTGTTPGKAIFRIRVVGPDERRPGFMRALYRSLLVYATGMGFGFEPLRWVTSFFAFLRVQQTGSAFWDHQAHTRIDQQPLGPARAFLVLLILAAIIAADAWTG